MIEVMAVRLSFCIPGKPVPKGRPRVVRRNGRSITFTPKRTRAWERCVYAHAMHAKLEWQLADHSRSWNRYGPHKVTLRFYGAHGAADVDNLAKAVLDGLQGAVIGNDRDVTALTCLRLPRDALGPRVEVEVEAI